MDRQLPRGIVYHLPGKKDSPMDYESDSGSNSNSGGSTKKTLIIVLSIVGGLVLLCGLSCVGIGIWAFKKFGDLPQVGVSAEMFSENLASGRIDAAYAQTSPRFQKKQTLEEFKALLKRYPALTTATSRNLSNMDVKQTPDCLEAPGQKVLNGPNIAKTVYLILVKEDEQWKVDSISVR